MNLIISIEPYGDPGEAGPFFIDAIFPEPVRAYALEYSWCEDDPDCTFDGIVLDEPTTRVSLWEPAYCEHSWCAIEAIRWAPIPEPTTASLVALGLGGLAFLRIVRGRKAWPLG